MHLKVHTITGSRSSGKTTAVSKYIESEGLPVCMVCDEFSDWNTIVGFNRTKMRKDAVALCKYLTNVFQAGVMQSGEQSAIVVEDRYCNAEDLYNSIVELRKSGHSFQLFLINTKEEFLPNDIREHVNAAKLDSKWSHGKYDSEFEKSKAEYEWKTFLVKI